MAGFLAPEADSGIPFVRPTAAGQTPLGAVTQAASNLLSGSTATASEPSTAAIRFGNDLKSYLDDVDFQHEIGSSGWVRGMKGPVARQFLQLYPEHRAEMLAYLEAGGVTTLTTPEGMAENNLYDLNTSIRASERFAVRQAAVTRQHTDPNTGQIDQAAVKREMDAYVGSIMSANAAAESAESSSAIWSAHVNHLREDVLTSVLGLQDMYNILRGGTNVEIDEATRAHYGLNMTTITPQNFYQVLQTVKSQMQSGFFQDLQKTYPDIQAAPEAVYDRLYEPLDMLIGQAQADFGSMENIFNFTLRSEAMRVYNKLSPEIQRNLGLASLGQDLKLFDKVVQDLSSALIDSQLLDDIIKGDDGTAVDAATEYSLKTLAVTDANTLAQDYGNMSTSERRVAHEASIRVDTKDFDAAQLGNWALGLFLTKTDENPFAFTTWNKIFGGANFDRLKEAIKADPALSGQLGSLALGDINGSLQLLKNKIGESSGLYSFSYDKDGVKIAVDLEVAKADFIWSGPGSNVMYDSDAKPEDQEAWLRSRVEDESQYGQYINTLNNKLTQFFELGFSLDPQISSKSPEPTTQATPGTPDYSFWSSARNSFSVSDTSQTNVANYIRAAAAELGIDPEIAVKVAMAEGLGTAKPAEGWQSFVKGKGAMGPGGREDSWGPFQLLIQHKDKDGKIVYGVGKLFMDHTGLDPRDPMTWQAQVDFALAHAKAKGWGEWYGAAQADVGDWDGINPGSTPTQQPVVSSKSPETSPRPQARPMDAAVSPQVPATPQTTPMETSVNTGEAAAAQAVDHSERQLKNTTLMDPAIWVGYFEGKLTREQKSELKRLKIEVGDMYFAATPEDASMISGELPVGSAIYIEETRQLAIVESVYITDAQWKKLPLASRRMVKDLGSSKEEVFYYESEEAAQAAHERGELPLDGVYTLPDGLIRVMGEDEDG